MKTIAGNPARSNQSENAADDHAKTRVGFLYAKIPGNRMIARDFALHPRGRGKPLPCGDAVRIRLRMAIKQDDSARAIRELPLRLGSKMRA